MELGLDFSRQDEASLGPLKLKQYLDTSGKLYAQVGNFLDSELVSFVILCLLVRIYNWNEYMIFDRAKTFFIKW